MALEEQLSSKALYRLYVEQGYSSLDIAEQYKTTSPSVRRLLRKYEIPIRSKSEARRLAVGIPISTKELERLYVTEQNSTEEIAAKLKCSATGIRDRLRSEGLAIRNRKEAKALVSTRGRKNFNGNQTEKAYLLGLRTGDLHVRTSSDSSPSIFVELNTTKSDMVSVFRDCFSSYTTIWEGNPDRLGAISMRAPLNRSFAFLLEKEDNIPKWITSNTTLFCAFLAGYTDSEGTFCLCRDNAVFAIKTQDINILRKIREQLVNLGVLCRPPTLARAKGSKDKFGTEANEEMWTLSVYRKEALLRLFDLLEPHLKHQDKLNRIEMLRENIHIRNRKYNNRKDRRFKDLYRKEGIEI